MVWLSKTHFLCFVIYSIASGAWVYNRLFLAETRLAGLERHSYHHLTGVYERSGKGKHSLAQARTTAFNHVQELLPRSIYSLLDQDIYLAPSFIASVSS